MHEPEACSGNFFDCPNWYNYAAAQHFLDFLMLYQIYETQRSYLGPFAELAHAVSRVFTNPSMPASHLPYANRISAGYDLFHRLAKNYEKPRFGITSVFTDGKELSIHERIEMEKPFCNLLRFKRYADDTDTLEKLLHHPAVLIVAPLSGHYSTLLRDTVRTMLQDHKVYITDWVNARDVPLSQGRFSLDDYVHYVQEFIRRVQAENGECHVIAVCQPTVPVMAAVSLMASRGETTPSSMVLMGGPVDATQSPTVVSDLAVQRSMEWFENNVIYRVPSSYAGAGRRVYPGFLQFAGFVAMNPNHHVTSYYDYFRNLIRGDGESTDAHRTFYDEYNAVLDLDADFYLDTIHTVFQEYKLVRGTWDVTNSEGQREHVRPADIRDTAILAVEGELDDIAGVGQTQASLTLCSGVPADKKQFYELKGAGHYGIFSGRRWREKCYPVVREFILRHHNNIVAPKRLRGYLHMFDNPEFREKIQEMLQASAPVPVESTVIPAAKKSKNFVRSAPVVTVDVSKVKKTTSPAPAVSAPVGKVETAANPASVVRRRVAQPGKNAGKIASTKKASTKKMSVSTAHVPVSSSAKPVQLSLSVVPAASKPQGQRPVTTWRGPPPDTAGSKKPRKA